MKYFVRLLPLALVCAFATTTYAQDENGIFTEIELGAVITSGNTENENIRYGLDVDWIRDAWTYKFTSDGFRSTQEDELTAHRLYHVVSAEYAINANSFVESRLAYEDDRFSGFDNQMDFTVSYGRNLLLDIENMDLALTAGAGMRRSETEIDKTDETIIRLGADYVWDLSEVTSFSQLLSVEAGEDSIITRSETAFETSLMDSLSLRLSFTVKNQSEVPATREKTDTETAITLLWRF